MKTHNKITILIIGVILVLMVFLVGYQYVRNREIDIYFQSQRISDGQIIDKVMDFQTRGSMNAVVDNAVWDGMVDFTKSKDTAWARENLGSSLGTFKFGYFAAFDANGFLLHSETDGQTVNIVPQPDTLISWFSRLRKIHHFGIVGDELYEFFGCVIVPTSDNHLCTKPHGYLIAAEHWDSTRIASLQTATGFKVTLLEKNQKVQGHGDAPREGELYRSLRDANDVEVATLKFSIENPFGEELTMLKYIAVGGLAMLLLTYFIFAFFTNRWIARPLRAITKSLSEGTIKPIYNLLGKKGGYGDIARLIRKYNEQNVALQIEVEERKNAEQKVIKLNESLELRVKERTAALEATLKEQEAFSYTVSHDLRSPLRAIDGFSTLLMEDYSKNLDEEAKRYLESIRNSGHKMARLIDGLIGFIQLNTTEVRCSSVNMKTLAGQIVNELTSASDRSLYTVNIGDLPIVVADAPLIGQVWHNLISNAVKFSKKSINPEITIGFEKSKYEYIFFVKDNGVGFNMKYYNKLYGVFQRLHEDFEYPGIGVGLAIVRRIIQLHGGRVWGEGVENEGATFYFTLPKEAVATK